MSVNKDLKDLEAIWVFETKLLLPSSPSDGISSQTDQNVEFQFISNSLGASRHTARYPEFQEKSDAIHLVMFFFKDILQHITENRVLAASSILTYDPLVQFQSQDPLPKSQTGDIR